jgi:PAS domain S-box-containing protein
MMKLGRMATRWPLLPGQGRSTSGTGASEMHDKPLPSASSISPVLPILAGVLAVAIFAIDTISTLDIAIAVLYAVVVLMGANFLQRRGVLLLSSACLALTVLSYLVSHQLTADTALVRCLVSLSAIAATTFLALKNQSANMVVRERARLLDLTHDTVFVRDMNDIITYWNRGAEELYGWRRDEAIGQVSHRLMKTVFPASLEKITAELFHTGRWEGELVHTKRDGTPVTVASRWSLQEDVRGRPVATMETNNDITEHKRADAELRESERRYRNIFQTAGVSIWEEDFSKVKTAIDELKAQGIRDFGHYFTTHPEFVRQAITMVRIVNVNEATLKLLAARRKEDLLVSLHKVFLPESEDVFAQVLIAIAEGRTLFEAETVLKTLSGDKLAVLLTIAFPAEAATLGCVLVSLMDITERNRTQEALQQAQAELAHVTRLTTLGELTASIAHEVNQPLAAIVTNGEACLRWLAYRPPELEEVRGAVESMISDGVRASEVVWGLRGLLKKSNPLRSLLNLNEVIEQLVLLVERELLNNRVTLRLELAPALHDVFGDRVQLQQVIMNLVINGIQSMASVTDRPRELLIRSCEGEDDQLMIEVRDRGSGIDPRDMQQLFNAFFTTKPNGMGMGLSICRSIVEAHGGRIWASSNVGPGATFTFTVPPARETSS